MIRTLIYGMVYLGSALMVYNICGFFRFTRLVRKQKTWSGDNRVLYVPLFLLTAFLLGYLAVGLFGEPDLIVAGILFGGSIFVFVMYRMLSDIVSQVFKNEEISARLLAAEETSRAKSDFLASISHEMRTPMNVILGLDTLALKKTELPPDTREQLEKIGHAARHLSSLIENILTFQQAENGETTLRSERFSLKEALEQICAQVSAQCEEKGLTFQTVFSKCAKRDYLGDAVELKRALLCILDNAVKYTDAPGTVHICVKCEQEEDDYTRVSFIISDTGVGIDEAFLPKIFQPLTQEDQSFTNRFGGSGMGLTVANSIVTRMGGSIQVVSHKGKGSIFTVSVPLLSVGGGACANCEGCKPDGSEACAMCGGCRHSVSVKKPAASVTLAGRRILIVEDVDENAEIVADLLELEDAESERAENGLVAVDMVRNAEAWHYDAILMDLRMPVMDGLESARQIRALAREDVKEIPIIALTANAFESDVEAALAAGMNAHLAKPADADLLYGALKYWISKTQKGDAVRD